MSVDVIGVLTESPNPQTYWRVLKKRLKDEGNETVTNCNALKLKAVRHHRTNSSQNLKYSYSDIGFRIQAPSICSRYL